MKSKSLHSPATRLALIRPRRFSPLALFFITLALLVAPSRAIDSSRDIRPDLPKIPEKSFSVREHGAKGDGTSDDTAALQATIDAVRDVGGGVVEVPTGTYLSGPLHLINNLHLHLGDGAAIKLLPIDRYPGGTKVGEPFLFGENLHDLALTGHGTIDGQGAAWWPLARTDGIKRPVLFRLINCERILIEDITLKNSPMFHVAINASSNITVRRATVVAPSSADPQTPSHNTDGLNITGHRILVEYCNVSVGDDNYACSGGTQDVLLQHNTFGTGHGVSMGSYTHPGIKNVTVRDCIFNATDCGIRIKSHRDRGGIVEDLLYEDLRMNEVLFPIIIYGTYRAAWIPEESDFRDHNHLTPELAARYPKYPVTAQTPVYRNLTFRNISATAAKSYRAGLIWGLAESPVSNILLQNVTIKADLPFGVYYGDNVRFENCTITTPDGVNKFVTTNAKVAITP